MAELAAVSEAIDGGARRHVPLADPTRQHIELADELRTAIEAVIERGDLTLGEEVEHFEQEYAAFCGVEHVVGVSSGTSALTLALIAGGIGPGDEVIVPALAAISAAVGVLHAGAVPVLCDVRADSGLIDVRSAAELVRRQTAAVLAVHLHGQPCDMHELQIFTDRNGLLMIEDATEAPGARFAGAPSGSLGDAAAFGFRPAGNLGALGSGGAVCTNDALIAGRIRRLRDLGRGRPGEHEEIGFDAALDGIQAAVLRVKLRHLERKNAARRAWAQMYRAVLPPTVTTLDEDPRAECVYHRFPVRVASREAVLRALRRRGIGADVHSGPVLLPAQPALLGYRLAQTGVGVAEAWAAEALALPMFAELSVDEVGRVAEALRSIPQ